MAASIASNCASILKAALLNPTTISRNSASGCREPNAADTACAKCYLLLHSQLASLREDYAQIDRGEAPVKNSRLENVMLFVEKSTNLLRLSGRIGVVESVPSVSPNPIVLYVKNRVVRLLVAYYHECAAHSSSELVVNELRQIYYIISLRPAVKSVASTCLRCRIRKAEPLTPPMDD